MLQKTVMALIEEWAEEMDVKVTTWHDLTLLKSFGDWLDSRRPSMRAADLPEQNGAEGLEPQWVCMTCKTMIGPVVDDDEHRCNCKDVYSIDLWRLAPVVEAPRSNRSGGG